MSSCKMLIYFPKFNQTWIFVTFKSSQYHISRTSIHWEEHKWMQTDEWMDRRPGWRYWVLLWLCKCAYKHRKGEVVSHKCHEYIQGSEVQLHSFLRSVLSLSGVNFMPWLLYPPEEKPSTQWIAGWVGPRACLGRFCVIHIPRHTDLVDIIGPTSHAILFTYSVLINLTSGKYNGMRPTHLVTIVKPCKKCCHLTTTWELWILSPYRWVQAEKNNDTTEAQLVSGNKYHVLTCI